MGLGWKVEKPQGDPIGYCNSSLVDAVSFGAATTGTWTLVVGWHDRTADTIDIQINNGVVNTASHAGGVLDGSAEFALGARRDTLPNYMSGRIDGAGLWKRVLNSSERAQLGMRALAATTPSRPAPPSCKRRPRARPGTCTTTPAASASPPAC
jgi:hypothetical protein